MKCIEILSKYSHSNISFTFRFFNNFFYFAFVSVAVAILNIWSGSRFNAFCVACIILLKHHESYLLILCIFGHQITINEMEFKSNRNEVKKNKRAKQNNNKKMRQSNWPTHWNLTNKRMKWYNGVWVWVWMCVCNAKKAMCGKEKRNNGSGTVQQ